MISNALRTEIERWAAKRDRNPVFVMARNKTLTQAMVTRYIANVTHMIKLTPGHLCLARENAKARGDLSLAAHYEHKLEEELGHSIWGENDLESLTRMVAKPPSPAPTANSQSPDLTVTPSINQLADYLPNAIEKDPTLYLSYLAFTEYITVLLGPELLTLIEDGCGVPRTSMTVIDNHIELDRAHSEEAWGCIDDLVGDPRMLAPLRTALLEMIAFFDGFCVELTAPAMTEVATNAVANVSAA